MNLALLKNTRNYTLKSVVLIFISIVALVTFIATLSTLVFILAITVMGMAARIIYKDFGGKRCIHCNSRFVSTFRPYDNNRTDICDTCQAWMSCIMGKEQERSYQEGIVRAEEAKAKAKTRAEETTRAHGERWGTEQDSPKPKPEQAFDPYEVLGVIRGASNQEIKTRYYKLMKVYHPDMVVHLGVETQKVAAEKAEAINRAYQMIANWHSPCRTNSTV
jgi:hypothetical protein